MGPTKVQPFVSFNRDRQSRLKAKIRTWVQFGSLMVSKSMCKTQQVLELVSFCVTHAIAEGSHVLWPVLVQAQRWEKVMVCGAAGRDPCLVACVSSSLQAESLVAGAGEIWCFFIENKSCSIKI